MENIGNIAITVSGTKGNLPLEPDNYDVAEIRQILEQAENLLITGERKNRPAISYDIQKGSVKHVFKTSMQYIIAFNAIIAQISTEKSLDFLDLPTAKAFETLQNIALQKNYSFSLQTSLVNSSTLEITSATAYFRTASLWAEADFYFYGKITSLGGKGQSSIHLSTSDAGQLTIHTPKEFLEEREDNLLYKTFGIHVLGKQNSETGEVDKSSLQFVELINYNAAYNEDYLQGLRHKAQKSWQGVADTNEWLRNLRGGYDA
jgi:hypothetical protein